MKNKKFKIPVWMLALDMVGSVLLGIGLAEHFANVGIVPESLRTEGFAVKLMVMGVALYIPAVLYFLERLINGKSREI